jgi:hypothetical protein
MSVSAKRGHECVSNCVFKLLENTHKNFMPFISSSFTPSQEESDGYGGSRELHMR